MSTTRYKLPACNKTKQPKSKIRCKKRAKYPKEKIVSLYLAECIGNSVQNLMIRHPSKKLQKKEGIGNRNDINDPHYIVAENMIAEDSTNFLSKPVKEPLQKKKRKNQRLLGKKFIRDFIYFARFGDEYSSGSTISFSKTLRWLKKAELLDNRRITMRDVEVHFIDKLKNGHELKILEFIRFLKSLSEDRGLHMSTVILKLSKCRPQRKRVKKKRKDVFSNFELVKEEQKRDCKNVENTLKVCEEKHSENTQKNQAAELEESNNTVKNTVLITSLNKVSGSSCIKKSKAIKSDREIKKALAKIQIADSPRCVQSTIKKHTSKCIYPTVKIIPDTKSEEYSQIADCKFYRANYKKNVIKMKKQVKHNEPLKLDAKKKQRVNSISTHLSTTITEKTTEMDNEYENYEYIESDTSLTDFNMHPADYAEKSSCSISHKCITDIQRHSEKGKESKIGTTGTECMVKNLSNFKNTSINKKINGANDVEIFHSMEPKNDIFRDLKESFKIDDNYSAGSELTNVEMMYFIAPLNKNCKKALSEVFEDNHERKFPHTNNKNETSPLNFKRIKDKGISQPIKAEGRYIGRVQRNSNLSKNHDPRSNKMKKPNNDSEAENKFNGIKSGTKVKRKDERTLTNLPVNQVAKLIMKSSKTNINDKLLRRDRKSIKDTKPESKTGQEVTLNDTVSAKDSDFICLGNDLWNSNNGKTTYEATVRDTDNTSVELKSKEKMTKTSNEKKYKIRKGVQLHKNEMKDPETEIQKQES